MPGLMNFMQSQEMKRQAREDCKAQDRVKVHVQGQRLVARQPHIVFASASCSMVASLCSTGLTRSASCSNWQLLQEQAHLAATLSQAAASRRAAAAAAAAVLPHHMGQDASSELGLGPIRRKAPLGADSPELLNAHLGHQAGDGWAAGLPALLPRLVAAAATGVLVCNAGGSSGCWLARGFNTPF